MTSWNSSRLSIKKKSATKTHTLTASVGVTDSASTKSANGSCATFQIVASAGCSAYSVSARSRAKGRFHDGGATAQCLRRISRKSRDCLSPSAYPSSTALRSSCCTVGHALCSVFCTSWLTTRGMCGSVRSSTSVWPILPRMRSSCCSRNRSTSPFDIGPFDIMLPPSPAPFFSLPRWLLGSFLATLDSRLALDVCEGKRPAVLGSLASSGDGAPLSAPPLAAAVSGGLFPPHSDRFEPLPLAAGFDDVLAAAPRGDVSPTPSALLPPSADLLLLLAKKLRFEPPPPPRGVDASLRPSRGDSSDCEELFFSTSAGVTPDCDAAASHWVRSSAEPTANILRERSVTKQK